MMFSALGASAKAEVRDAPPRARNIIAATIRVDGRRRIRGAVVFLSWSIMARITPWIITFALAHDDPLSPRPMRAGKNQLSVDSDRRAGKDWGAAGFTRAVPYVSACGCDREPTGALIPD